MLSVVISFLTGGLMCLAAQLLLDLTKLTPARILVLFVVSGVILSAFGFYGPFAEWASCGAAVPLSGFGHLLAEGVKKAVGEKGFIGIFTGGLIAGAGGTEAAMLFSLLAAVFFRSKSK